MRTETTYVVTDANGGECKFEYSDDSQVQMVYAMCQASASWGKKVSIIKMVRYMLNIGLKEAKYFVEDAWK